MDSMPSMRTSTPPFTVTPMQPTQVARPFHVEGFGFEEKVDGYRMVAYKHDGTVRLISRQGIDHTNMTRSSSMGRPPCSMSIWSRGSSGCAVLSRQT
jgi:ATP-dependent DNA ligase